MKIGDCRITMLFDHDGLSIELYDYNAHITFFRGKLDPKATVSAFSRLAMVEMKNAEVYNTGK